MNYVTFSSLNSLGEINFIAGTNLFIVIFTNSNNISNIGYSGIRFSGDKAIIRGNNISNIGLVLADGGGIYSSHSMGGNKKIEKNTITNVRGNVNGTLAQDHGTGIYLDDLSLHFRIDSNYIYNCDGGIYIHNSRSDTIINNQTINNFKFDLFINHTSMVLNGGKLNYENDPEFDPEKLDSIPKDYIWDKNEGILYYKEKKRGVVYLRPGNNIIRNNLFISNLQDNIFSIQIGTWQNLTRNLILELSGNPDFFYDNLPDSLLKDVSLLFYGSNVKDMNRGGKKFNVIQNKIKKEDFDFLKQVKFKITWGVKKETENILFQE